MTDKAPRLRLPVLPSSKRCCVSWARLGAPFGEPSFSAVAAAKTHFAAPAQQGFRFHPAHPGPYGYNWA